MLGLLKSIEVGMSPGPDGINSRFMRRAREEIARAIPRSRYIFLTLVRSWRLESRQGCFFFDEDKLG